MEKQIRTSKEKLVISFAGCTKKDKKDNSDKGSESSLGAAKSSRHKQPLSLLTYKL